MTYATEELRALLISSEQREAWSDDVAFPRALWYQNRTGKCYAPPWDEAKYIRGDIAADLAAEVIRLREREAEKDARIAALTRERDRLREALKGVIREADRRTNAFIEAHAALGEGGE